VIIPGQLFIIHFHFEAKIPALVLTLGNNLIRLIMANHDPKQELKKLLRELFQLDNTDLDFGIYRILNLVSSEVETFINTKLDEKIEKVKDELISHQTADIKAEIERISSDLKTNFGDDFENIDASNLPSGGQVRLQFEEKMQEYNNAKEALKTLRVSEETETSIYNALYDFFSRYYEGGDFISMPRAGRDNYMIPYNGEEVKLYWANYDQYYIKTADNFKNYIFNNGSENDENFRAVEFKIVDVDTPINNNQDDKKRLFVPTEDPFEWLPDEKKFAVKFYYKKPTDEEKRAWGDKQDVKKDDKGINQRLLRAINEKITEINDRELTRFYNRTRKNSKGEDIPLFFYHLQRYTTINKFDYFIHKDLRGFLTRELDYYIKNEIISLSFLDPHIGRREMEESIRLNALKASCIRDVALTIIDFVSELEDFQKRLFEKKKFVVQSDYCMTLDKIPEAVYDEVVEFILSDEGKPQLDNWVDLGFIDESTPFGGSDEKLQYLKDHDKLVLDTQYLPANLKWKLLAAFDNLDEQTNGLLINSENWQGLNIIKNKFYKKIKSIYIDPPYNTGADGFVYKDSYRHSSWISFIYDRVRLSKLLLNSNGLFSCSIDDKEYSNLKFILDKLFQGNYLNTVAIKMSESSGVKMSHVDKRLPKLKEYLLIFKENDSHIYPIKINKENNNEEKNAGNKLDNYLKYYNKIIINPEDNPESWQIVSVKKYMKAYGFKISDESIKNFKIENSARIVYRTNNKSFANLSFDTPITKVISATGIEYIWWEGKQMLFLSDYIDEYLGDLWTDISTINLNKEGGVDFENGKKPEMLVYRWLLLSSKKSDLILDYFLGSGTSSSVALKAKRNFIGIEMGDYFYSLSLPRLKKTLYGENGGSLKEIIEWQGGGLINYLKLEQYEDTLNNIEFTFLFHDHCEFE